MSLSTVQGVTGDNPFGLMYSALWEMALRSPQLNLLVKPGNRIRYDRDKLRSEEKPTVQTSDLPELALVAENISGLLIGSSSGSMVKRSYAFIINTGDYRVDRLYPVEWALLCAMCDWKTAVSRLRWKDKAFCKRLELLAGVNAESTEAQARNINGWTAVWRCEAEMWFDTSDLVKELANGSP